MQTIQQKRAKYALEQVESAKKSGVDPQEYKSYAAALPAMIHTNGLGQAAAFYKSKGKTRETYKKLYDLLSGWLCWENQPYAGCNDLIKGITERDMHAYRLAQAEAMVLIEWVKKFAEAYME